ncbi:isochorismatase [Seminavis robusta]|uniref:nicotinamidase n=1 Tax=Seminavis robusta TaxID=568900 RepID=A0A9N8EL52_9STRA|nr:isochorismatase [Seminavis robusta]|eukprot:Sro1181_g249820.1 isochorismatase (253) ;mRNA; f:7044-8150
MNAIVSLSIVLLIAAVASMASANNNTNNKTALLIVDVQECFMEAAGTSSGVDGSLSVADTASIVPLINQLRDETECLFDVVIRSQDFHPPHHISFGPTHGWIGTLCAFVVGQRRVAHYETLKTPLDQILTDNQITTIYVVGIATDYCVYYSTLDAISLGYETIVVIDATRGIANETVDAAQQDMLNKGATIMNAADILALDYPCSAPNDTTTTTTSTSNASSAGVGGSTIQFIGGLALLSLGLLITSALAAL